MTHPKIQEMLDAAERDIRRLRAARTSEGAREAWISFLENSNRAINRLEGYSKRTNQQEKHKYLISNLIWANDLSKYMRAARNAHEHGVENIEISEPFNSRANLPNGRILGSPVVYGKSKDGQLVVMPQAAPIEVKYASHGVRTIELKPGIRMIPVVSARGETIFPPHVDVEAEYESEPLAAARQYLSWIRDCISDFD